MRLNVAFAVVMIGSWVSSSPTQDGPLILETALDEDEAYHFDVYQDRPDTHRMAVDVADALVKSLENAIEDCDIDPADREGSIRRCGEARLKASESAPTTSTTKDDNEGSSKGEDQKPENPLVLLKTDFLNLNEEMKSKEGISDADLNELLAKIEKVVSDPTNLFNTDSTVVPIPSASDLEAAVTAQDYDSKYSEFWNTIFSVSDKVAMSLLLRVKSVQREAAKNSLKTFLQGSDEDRLKILADTLKLNKRRIEGKPDPATGSEIKRSETGEPAATFIAYDEHGKSFVDPATEGPIKRSGFVDATDHLLSDKEFDEQLKRYGFDRSFESAHPQFEHVASERQDVGRQSQEFKVQPGSHLPKQGIPHHGQGFHQRHHFQHHQVLDKSGQPIKRSGLDSYGHMGDLDEEILSKMEVPHEFHEVPVVFEKRKPADLHDHFTDSDLDPEIPATEIPDKATLHMVPEIPLHSHPIEKGHKKEKQDPLTSDASFFVKYDENAVRRDDSALEKHFVVISVATVVVICALLAVFVNRQRLRRYYSKKVAYRRID